MRSLATLLLLGLVFCAGPCAPPVSEAAEGASGAPRPTPRRIVSLAPNITEILYALGLGDSVVGVTDFCDFPPEARAKARIGGMTNPSLEAVLRLKPDLVVMTTDGNPRDFKKRLEGLGLRTYLFREKTLKGLARGIRALGAALNAEARAEALAAEAEKRLAIFKRYREARAASGAGTPSALFVVWPRPLIAAGPGTLIDEAMALAGARNVAGDAASGYPRFSIEEALRRSPDIIFIGADGRGGGQSNDLLERLRSVDAVSSGRVYYPGDALLRLSPRSLDGIEELRGFLNAAAPAASAGP